MKDRNKWVLYTAIIAVLLFSAFRFYHYLHERQTQNHDKYLIKCDETHKCPDMDMFGLKFSLIMGILTLNTFVLIYIAIGA